MRISKRGTWLCFNVHHKQFNSLRSRLELRTLYERNGSPLAPARANVARRTIGGSVCLGHTLGRTNVVFTDGSAGPGCLAMAEGNARGRAAPCGIAQRAGAARWRRRSARSGLENLLAYLWRFRCPAAL